MAKLKDYYSEIYREDELYDFAIHCGIDDDIFAELFWHEVVQGHEQNLSPDEIYRNIWNWIDCNGEEDVA